jgi:hypothetical protein
MASWQSPISRRSRAVPDLRSRENYPQLGLLASSSSLSLTLIGKRWYAIERHGAPQHQERVPSPVASTDDAPPLPHSCSGETLGPKWKVIKRTTRKSCWVASQSVPLVQSSANDQVVRFACTAVTRRKQQSVPLRAILSIEVMAASW